VSSFFRPFSKDACNDKEVILLVCACAMCVERESITNT